MIEIDFLPARFGDCIWIEFGPDADRRRILIDGGTAGTRKEITQRLDALERRGEPRHFDLVVVTHIDRDHIEGILGLLEQDDPGFTAGDIWFNGWCHLPANAPDEVFGAVQGERLSAAILKNELCWNAAFGGGAAAVSSPTGFPTLKVGKMTLTLLTPTLAELAALKPVWDAEVNESNLDPEFERPANDDDTPPADVETFGGGETPDVDELAQTPFDPDPSVANGSSISLLLEYGNKRALLAGDAHAEVLVRAIRRLVGGKLSVDLFKLPHHGSSYSVSPELIELVPASKYVFSTNGSIYHHPAPQSVARVIKGAPTNPELIFNYFSRENAVWADPDLQSMHGYTARHAKAGKPGIPVTV